MYKKLTENQKLKAFEHNFYCGVVTWIPKKGDYYTTTRADLELYQIIEEDEKNFYTIYCNVECEPSKWSKNSFLKEFGENRMFVPIYILEK